MPRKNKRGVLILGSTGSIGDSGLRVIESLGKQFQVSGLSANKSVAKIIRQAKKFRPKAVALADKNAAFLATTKLKRFGIKVFSGPQAAVEMVARIRCDVVLAGIVGVAGLPATLEAVKRGRQVGLANKEALVVAGSLMTREARKNGAKLLPVDSEHTAIFQCLQGARDMAEVRRIILTASGGPFLRWTPKQMLRATKKQALRHPTWKMGQKITIDSATLMNKGLEVIEAHFLFGMPPDKISVVIHPQSLVHSMVEYEDGSILAQLGPTDMRVPIQFALTYPRREAGNLPRFQWQKGVDLRFEAVPRKKFPCLDLAYKALRLGGTAPAILNEANEVVVGAFLQGRVEFGDIPACVRKVLGDSIRESKNQGVGEGRTLAALMSAQKKARQKANEYIDKLERTRGISK